MGITRNSSNRISFFQGRYRFLSNFWPANVFLDGVEYPSVEHAYQAAKTFDPLERLTIGSADTPSKAKRLGRQINYLRSDWESIKLDVMKDLVQQKFRNTKYLRNALLATGDKELIEGNSWGDTFYGVCNGVGENHLGKILMQVRSALREEK